MPERVQRDTYDLNGNSVRLVFARETETSKEYNTEMVIWTENASVVFIFESGKAAIECYKAMTAARVTVNTIMREEPRVKVNEETLP